MTLQGDLNSFALPDVLRLLAGTSKSGRFEVRSDRSTGELRLEQGRVGDAQVTSAPAEASTSEVLFELLRLQSGSFAFTESEPTGGIEGMDVEIALAEASALVAEWEAVESVVPSMRTWLTMAREIDDAAVQVTADRWRTLAAIGSGATPEQLAATLDLGALATCQSVKDLVELALVEVGTDDAPRADAPVVRDLPMPQVELDTFEEFEDGGLTDFEDLAAEDGPVMMEEREDALLPEPLPGEGVAYEGEELTGVVDGRTAIEPDPESDEGPEASAEPALPPMGEAEEGSSAPAVEPMPVDDRPGTDEPIAHDELADASAFAAGIAPEPSDDEVDDDDERGSLLRFLSTVKP